MAAGPKEVLSGVYDALNSGDLDRLDDLLADDLVEHEEVEGLPPTKEGVKLFFAGLRAAFPDVKMTAQELIGEGDLASARFIFTGTQEGEFMGLPASGKSIEVQGIDILRTRDGQAVEHWGVMDMVSMLQQLGAMPAPA